MCIKAAASASEAILGDGGRAASRCIRVTVERGVGPMSDFPSMKAKELVAVLGRSPLGYRVTRQKGSHRQLEAQGRPTLAFAFHDKVTLAPGLVRKILVKDVGLSVEEAVALLRRGRP